MNLTKGTVPIVLLVLISFERKNKNKTPNLQENERKTAQMLGTFKNTSYICTVKSYFWLSG